MKKTMSFEKQRQVLRNLMEARAKGRTVIKIIPFQNQDVPNYLARLNRFEKASQKSRLIIVRI